MIEVCKELDSLGYTNHLTTHPTSLGTYIKQADKLIRENTKILLNLEGIKEVSPEVVQAIDQIRTYASEKRLNPEHYLHPLDPLYRTLDSNRPGYDLQQEYVQKTMEVIDEDYAELTTESLVPKIYQEQRARPLLKGSGLALVAIGGLLACVAIAPVAAYTPIDHQDNFDVDVRITGLVTSHYDANEELFHGEKVPVYDINGKFLGKYREDFLERLSKVGTGKGDGNSNVMGLPLTRSENNFFLTWASLGNHNNRLIPLNLKNPEINNYMLPSIAVSPAQPVGSTVKILDLGPNEDKYPSELTRLLLKSTFSADDTAVTKGARVYCGFEEKYSLFFNFPGATIGVDRPDR